MLKTEKIKAFCFIGLSYFLFFSQALIARSKRISSFSAGVRLGVGYTPQSRFYNYLENYSALAPNSGYSKIKLGKYHSLNNGEILFGLKWYDGLKFSLALGNSGYHQFSLQERHSRPYYLHLKNRIYSNYMILSYHYTWNFRKFFVDTGVGLGINETYWKTDGFSVYPPYGYQRESSKLYGNGLSYRMETSINKKLFRSLTMQLGVRLDYHTIPSFSGLINQEVGNYYLNTEGKLNSGQNEELINSAFFQSYYTRKLEMANGNLIFFLAAIYNFQI